MTTMPVAELDDVALATRACGGDRAAFAALVDRHYDFIFAVAWRWCANRADAEDVAQDACIKLARALSGWRREGKFTTWLYRLVLSATHDLGRKREREMRKVQAFHAHALTEMQGPTDDGDSLDDLWDAVRELPPKQRDAVLLADRDEYARKHAVWLGAFFGGVLVFGLVQAKMLAIAGGLLGLAWIGRAFWRAR